jgi:DNA-binding transcriptional regulator YiaG
MTTKREIRTLYKPCPHCKGTSKVKIKQPPLITADTKRMAAIMKRHNLNQLAVGKILDISQSTVQNWFHRKTNMYGKIKSIYFTVLKMRGYE